MTDQPMSWGVPWWRPRLRKAAIIVIIAASGWIIFGRLPVVAGVYWFVTLFTGGILAVLSASQPRSPRWAVIYRTVMFAFAFFAPIAVVVFLRLLHKTCAPINLLLLPWGDTAEMAARVAAVAVWAVSTTLIIIALRTPWIRGAGLVAYYWSLWSIIPAFVMYFLSVYGDPAPSCIPV